MEGRAIVREANLDHFKEHPDFAPAMDRRKRPPKRLYLNRSMKSKKPSSPVGHVH
jgi:hypothetical protein